MNKTQKCHVFVRLLGFHSLLVVVGPGQRQPVSVQLVVIFHHVLGALVRGDEDDLKLGWRVAFVHQLRVEVAQNGREVSTRWTPPCGEVDPHHFIPQRLFGIHKVSVFVEKCPTCKHFHHVCESPACQPKRLRSALAHSSPRWFLLRDHVYLLVKASYRSERPR